MRTGLVAIALLVAGGCQPAQAQWWYSQNSSSNGTNNSRTGVGTVPGAPIGYPMGTQTSESPRYYSTPGLSPAPGVSSSTGMGLSPAQFSYYNNGGFGYFQPNRFSAQFPAMVSPVPIGGGYFQFGGLGARSGYWRSPSGYYYPWCPAVYSVGMTIPQTQTIFVMSDGAVNPAKPPVTQVLSDMKNFIEDAKSKNQIDQSNYEALQQRIESISDNAQMLAAKSGGTLDSQDETTVRRELNAMVTEIMRAVNP